VSVRESACDALSHSPVCRIVLDSALYFMNKEQ